MQNQNKQLSSNQTTRTITIPLEQFEKFIIMNERYQHAVKIMQNSKYGVHDDVLLIMGEMLVEEKPNE